MCSKDSIQNDLNIKNNDNIQSCETPRKKNYSIPTTSTTNQHAKLIVDTSVSLLNLHTATKFPSVGKEYMCFHNDGKTAQAAKCVKSRIMTKVIDSVLLINTFEQIVILGYTRA